MKYLSKEEVAEILHVSVRAVTGGNPPAPATVIPESEPFWALPLPPPVFTCAASSPRGSLRSSQLGVEALLAQALDAETARLLCLAYSPLFPDVSPYHAISDIPEQRQQRDGHILKAVASGLARHQAELTAAAGEVAAYLHYTKDDVRDLAMKLAKQPLPPHLKLKAAQVLLGVCIPGKTLVAQLARLCDARYWRRALTAWDEFRRLPVAPLHRALRKLWALARGSDKPGRVAAGASQRGDARGFLKALGGLDACRNGKQKKARRFMLGRMLEVAQNSYGEEIKRTKGLTLLMKQKVKMLKGSVDPETGEVQRTSAWRTRVTVVSAVRTRLTEWALVPKRFAAQAMERAEKLFWQNYHRSTADVDADVRAEIGPSAAATST